MPWLYYDDPINWGTMLWQRFLFKDIKQFEGHWSNIYLELLPKVLLALISIHNWWAIEVISRNW